MRRLLAAAFLASLLGGAGQATAEAARNMTLTLPRAAAPNEAVWVEVRAGYLARGAEIVVSSQTGKEIGVISPFAIRGLRDAGAYSFALPPGDVRRGKVTVRLSLERAGRSPRAPTRSEVKAVRIVFVKVAR